MYNKYMSEDNVFSELYRPVEAACEEDSSKERKCDKKENRFDLKKLLHGIDVGKMGIVPLVLLLLLLYDVDDEEKLIIIAIAIIFGI